MGANYRLIPLFAALPFESIRSCNPLVVYISLVDTSEKSEPTQDRSFLANILQNGTCFRIHIPKILTIVPAFYKKRLKITRP